MRYSIPMKFLAVLLCACALLVSLGSGLLVAHMAAEDVYTEPDSIVEDQKNDLAYSWANCQLGRELSEKLGGCGAPLLQVLYNGSIMDVITSGAYVITDPSGKVLADTRGTGPYPQVYDFAIRGVYYRYFGVYGHLQVHEDGEQYWVTPEGKVIWDGWDLPENGSMWLPDMAFTGEPNTTAPTTGDQRQDGLTEEQIQDVDSIFVMAYYDETLGHVNVIRLGQVTTQEHYQVKVYLPQGAFQDLRIVLLEYLVGSRYWMIGLLIGGLLLFAVTAVYLCCAAGRKKGREEIVPGGLNRLPLDLYALGTVLAEIELVYVCFRLLDYALDSSYFINYVNSPISMNVGALCLAGVCALAGCLLFVGFCFAAAAQFKTKDFYWLRHSAVGFCLRMLLRGLKWLWKHGVVGLIGGAFRAVGRFIRRIYELLPLIWQWLLVGMGLFFVLLFGIWHLFRGSGLFWMLWAIVVCVLVVLYGSYSFGLLLKGAKRMSQGDLNEKVDGKYLIGSFKDFAQALNALGDAAIQAAQKQMRSERMKAELITNVSHDIKTPLTSIINYVDLLQKTDDPQERVSYLEVLDRQSQRMKKLIDDLMEMSKASTGNLTAEIRRLDLVEAVTQALGEFSDKLAGADLTVVFDPPKEPVWIQADGRLCWRVMSNLLNNAVKYALPGTRVYIELAQEGYRVRLSIKNVSREQLRHTGEELLERFVRDDASRNTEGSGLGLNIAKSLMELQRGTLELTVDGDLFKAVLTFPT